MKFAGRWYPADTRSLNRIWQKAQISSRLEREPAALGGTAVGAVLPHAGLVYSAAAQLSALQQFRLENTHIILIAPSHYQLLQGEEFFTADISALETPYGNVNVELPRNPAGIVRYPLAPRALADEHAVELLLPGIAAVLSGKLPGAHSTGEGGLASAPIEPLLTPRLALNDRETARNQVLELGRQLDERIREVEAQGRRIRVFISSDFSHYGPRFSHTPLGRLGNRETRRGLRGRDLSVAAAAAEGRWEDALEQMLADQPPSICGIAGILAFARFAQIRGLGGKLCAYYSSATLSALDAQLSGEEQDAQLSGEDGAHNPIFNLRDEDALEPFYDGSENSVSYCSGVWYES